MGFRSSHRAHPRDAEDMVDLLELYRSDGRFSRVRAEGARLVPGNGSSHPFIMVVGDAPGAVDETAERPFAGRDGQILRSLIHDVAEIPKDAWWGTYLLKHRLARQPTVMESIAAAEYVEGEHNLIGKPAVVIAVGSMAWEAIGKPELGGVLSYAGKPMTGPWGARHLCAMLHPRYGLRYPELQDEIESHWENLAQVLREDGLL